MIKLYRYYDMSIGEKVHIKLERFHVIKETRCGYWYIPDGMNAWPEGEQQESKRWVSKAARVRRCYPTKDEAWKSYRARKYHQQGHLQLAQRRLDAILALIKDMPTHTASEDPERLNVRIITDSVHGLLRTDQ